MKPPLSGQTILITGASMGIGEFLAREFSQRGADLLLVARSEERLAKLCEEFNSTGTKNTYRTADLAEAQQVSTLIQQVLAHGKLDGLVHNAGIGLYGALDSLEEADMRRLFEINFFSYLELVRALLPLLRQSRNAKVMTVSSIVAWRAIPRLNVYSASKSALNGFNEALRVELAPHGIRLINTYPGRTRTAFSANAKSSGWRPFSTDSEGMPAEQVARKLARAYVKGKRDEFVSWSNRFLVWGNFLFPKLIDWGLGKYFQKIDRSQLKS
jgi:short-subunit dehydrogenase